MHASAVTRDAVVQALEQALEQQRCDVEAAAQRLEEQREALKQQRRAAAEADAATQRARYATGSSTQ